MPFVYFIKSKVTKWVYVGSTSNLPKRLKQHNLGEVRSTKHRAPYEVIYTEIFEDIKEARQREKELKTNRSKKDDILKKLI